jgi:Mg2+-importing ATPase
VYGPNAVASHEARVLPVLWHQIRSPLLGLPLAAALASSFLREGTDAMIIGAIVALSVGLGFANEYRRGAGGAGVARRDTAPHGCHQGWPAGLRGCDRAGTG